MDTYRSQMALAALQPVKAGDKINFHIEGSTVLYTQVREVVDYNGVLHAWLQDDACIVLPAGPDGKFTLKYHGTSTKREYFCRREPTWTAEQRAEAEKKLYQGKHKDFKGLTDGEPSIVYLVPGVGTSLVKVKDLSNAEIYDLLPLADQIYPRP